MKAKQAEKALEDGLAHVEALIAEALGNESRCSALRNLDEEQKRDVRLYVQTWIEAPLQAALATVKEADRDNLAAWRLTGYVGGLDRQSDFGRRLDEDALATLRETF